MATTSWQLSGDYCNTLHPANARLAPGRATHSHLHASGLAWGDTSGKNDGHFVPFHWQN